LNSRPLKLRLRPPSLAATNKHFKQMFTKKKNFSKKARTFWLFGLLAAVLLGWVQISVSQAPNNQEQKNFKEILKKEIEETEKQIEEYGDIIASKETEAQTLSGEIQKFDAQIKKIELEIKKTNLVLEEAELAIREREAEISKIEGFLSQRKILLREFLKEIHNFDEHSFLEIILQNNEISDFFDEVQALQNVHNNLQGALKEFKEFKKGLETEKEAYEGAREEQLALNRLQKLQQNELKEKRNGRKRLLGVTKGEEKKYQNLLKEAKKSVTEIKKQLFVLEGMSITFEEALDFAKFASERTGVRPALLLAVLHVETKLGTDLGTGNWKRDMKPGNQQKAFKEICEKLNLDPDLIPVSRKPSYGWGGAMGPGQFLPQTWLSYENEIAQLAGHNPPNPWDLKDAFVATALKLAKAGANLKTYESERKSVLIFFAGSRWNRPHYSWYGTKIMNQAEIYQKQINILEGK